MPYDEDKSIVGEKVDELLSTLDNHGILKEFEKVNINKVFTSTKHDTLLEATLSDIVDAVPIVGDISNAIRVKDAIERQDDLATAMQTIDTLAGLVPVYGDIVDILTPTNTVLYIFDKVPEAADVATLMKTASNSIRDK
jgi:hypothetical protein